MERPGWRTCRGKVHGRAYGINKGFANLIKYIGSSIMCFDS